MHRRRDTEILGEDVAELFVFRPIEAIRNKIQAAVITNPLIARTVFHEPDGERNRISEVPPDLLRHNFPSILIESLSEFS